MDTDEPGWDLYRSFLAVAGEGSLSAAARMLGMTQPSLGRHVRQLETMLGVALFTRSPQGLALTELGAELAEHARGMAAASAALRRTASGSRQDARGVVRITCSEVIGGEVLPAMLAGLRRQQPGIVIELSLSDATEDLLRKDADIAVRMLRPSQAALVARRVGAIGLGLFAHRCYLKERGTPRTLADLRAHALIGFDRETPALRAMRGRVPGGEVYAREHFALRTDSPLAQLAALRAGYGIGACQRALARRERQLVPVLPEAFGLDLDTWLVMHEDQRTNRRVRLVYDYLFEALATYVAEGA
ncbi:LysR family transcriptional regulator [Rhodanobacter sp. DHB23]|uniref:LysR family transcriptional regulator n=1 Tax=Rhodanobacter sp. DHB23 TaxID=2775923 RepID=UPI0017823F2F|nr:LysR family transcriptional regulator [Rhodanobacter sp. DHB23]MBD8871579.1 LysR family transcriptional regulator [Rhodanobacter sp. DHB23]